MVALGEVQEHCCLQIPLFRTAIRDNCDPAPLSFLSCSMGCLGHVSAFEHLWWEQRCLDHWLTATYGFMTFKKCPSQVKDESMIKKWPSISSVCWASFRCLRLRCLLKPTRQPMQRCFVLVSASLMSFDTLMQPVNACWVSQGGCGSVKGCVNIALLPQVIIHI